MENRKTQYGKKGEDDKLGYVDYKSDTEINLALKYFDWEFYGKAHNRDISTQNKVLEYLEKMGFKYKTLGELWKEGNLKNLNPTYKSRYDRMATKNSPDNDSLPF
jgi:NAD-dependent DNA ligase